MDAETERQHHLIQGLLDPQAYPHAVERVRHIETHISHVLLAGDYAYKIKKPLDLGFLDYRGLARRHHYCREELRLNRRTAPDIYLDVVGVGGAPDAPRITDEQGEGCLEYAVRMRRFDPGALLSERLQSGEWPEGVTDTLADGIARFHQAAAVAGPDAPWGTPEQVHGPVQANFRALAGQVDAARLQALAGWADERHRALRDTFGQRRRAGHVRECHGDMHLGNIVMWQGRPQLFDGIEFNEGLRWIDVINDIAFLMMDLEERGRPDQAWGLINRYLEWNGDYAGLAVLDYYRCYRAMVRAKVAGIRLRQDGLDSAEASRANEALQAYLRLAQAYTRPRPACLLLTSGLSGSGKSWLSRQLAQAMGLVRLRSDIERKRLFGLSPLAQSGSGIDAGIYTAAASQRTYRRLQELATVILDAGHAVVVDAAFLDRARRRDFVELAQRQGVPALVIRCEADEATLRQRIRQRRASGSDASEADLAVLQQQQLAQEPPDAGEQAFTLNVDTAKPLDPVTLVNRVEARLGEQAGWRDMRESP